MANKTKRMKEKNRAIKAAREAARRAEQSARDKQHRKIVSPKEIIEGYVADILNLMKYKIEISTHLDMRIKQAEMLIEKYPEKYSNLRLEELKDTREAFTDISKQIDNMAAQIGMLQDLETYQEKMRFVSEHSSEAAMAQYDFNNFGNRLNSVDKRYIESFAKVTRGEDLDDVLKSAGIELEQVVEENKEFTNLDEEPSSVDNSGLDSSVSNSYEEPLLASNVDNSHDESLVEVPVSEEEATKILEEDHQ